MIVWGRRQYNDPIRSSWATKVSEIGQQALVGAKGAEESQGRKDHGIPATVVRKAKLSQKLPKTKVSKTLGFATDLTNTSDRSAARTLPKARLTDLPQPDCISSSSWSCWHNQVEALAHRAVHTSADDAGIQD